MLVLVALIFLVSIHAPAEGATRLCRGWDLAATVSIHAPAEGATFAPLANRRLDIVSIHAPAEGATTLRADVGKEEPLFQSTRPRRARPRLAGDPVALAEFQSTRPRRARPGIQAA